MPHTSGPWTAVTGHAGDYVIRNPQQASVALVYNTFDKIAATANARLIAAAPTMLRVLQDLVEASDAEPEYLDLTDFIDAARMVIAEATTLPPS